MNERLVIDTGPLIALARGGALDQIGALSIEFVAPRQVFEELERGRSAGHLPALPAWLKRLDLGRPLDGIGVAALDVGEAAVIQLALEQEIRTVCIDEVKARRYARSVGLGVTGALGLLLRAKNQGVVERLEPIIGRMQTAGVWYRPRLVEVVLRAAGERP